VRTWATAKRLMFSLITCLGRRTITGLICTQGAQYCDWSKIYRLFEKERFDPGKLFSCVRTTLCGSLPEGMPVIAALDDTLLRKTGRKIAGTSWRRDPLGPAFRANFIWAQRFVQMSMIVPSNGLGSAARGVPVDLVHAPTPRKPRKNAAPEEWERYRQAQDQMRVSKVGADRIAHLRQKLDDDPANKGRRLIVTVDGGYANREVFRSIPEGTVLIARIRRDAALFGVPEQETTGRGRKRLYGMELPTPEQIRQNERLPWQRVQAYAAGNTWNFDVKVLRPIRWKAAGGRDLQLVVIRPTPFRRTKLSPREYKNPAYLVCSDPDLPIEQLLQSYLWRWEIEVNFRDEKTIMGTGQAQVRTHAAVKSTTAFAVASYAMLHTAAIQCGLKTNGLPLPKWRKAAPPTRCSTNQLVSRVRAELWAKAFGTNLEGFANQSQKKQTHFNSQDQMGSAVLYAIQ